MITLKAPIFLSKRFLCGSLSGSYIAHRNLEKELEEALKINLTLEQEKANLIEEKGKKEGLLEATEKQNEILRAENKQLQERLLSTTKK